MDKYIIRIAWLGFILLLISCSQQKTTDESVPSQNSKYGNWQNVEQPPIRFELKQTIGDNKDLLLPQTFKIEGPVTDNNGNIYFIDGQQGVLYSFSSDGNKRWSSGTKGKGPGDFSEPNGLITDGQYLYTANVNGTRIDQFDLTGQLTTSRSLEQMDLSFASVEGFISDSLLVTSSTAWDKIGRTVTIFNAADSLKKISQFEVIPNKEIEVPKGFSYGVDITILDSLIAAGNVATYKIKLYNHKGRQLKTISREFEKLVRPGFAQAGNSRSMRSYGTLSAPVSLSDDYFLTSLSWPTNVEDPDRYLEKSSAEDSNVPEVEYHSSLDLYRSNGALLFSLESQGQESQIGSIAYVDDRGYLYTKSETPVPQIRKYKLIINSPESRLSK